MDNQAEIKQLRLTDISDGGIEVAYHDDDIVYILNIEQLKYHANMQIRKLTIICCVSGKMDIAVDDKIYNLTANCLLIVYPNSVVRNCMTSVCVDFKILCISARYAENFFDGKDTINIGMFLKKTPLIHVTEDKLKNFLGLIDVFSVTCDKRHPYYGQIISKIVEATLFAILGFIKMMYKDEIEMKVNEFNSAEKIFSKFISMLNKYDNKTRYVSYYAGELCITPKYLTRICKDVSGHTASYWVKEYTIKHIKHYLRFTSLTVKEISIIMGFPNISFFTHYFKTNGGYTPADYRRICENLVTETMIENKV